MLSYIGYIGMRDPKGYRNLPGFGWAYKRGAGGGLYPVYQDGLISGRKEKKKKNVSKCAATLLIEL